MEAVIYLPSVATAVIRQYQGIRESMLETSSVHVRRSGDESSTESHNHPTARVEECCNGEAHLPTTGVASPHFL
jgi:hypothetical protein